MARRRISVDKIKEVIRYGVTTELSERAIGRALKVSRTAVTKYLECFRGSGLTWEQAQELPDSELLAVLEGNRPPRAAGRAISDDGQGAEAQGSDPAEITGERVRHTVAHLTYQPRDKTKRKVDKYVN